jgi:hypothetical protein
MVLTGTKVFSFFVWASRNSAKQNRNLEAQVGVCDEVINPQPGGWV